MQLTAVYMKVPEGYIAFVEELPRATPWRKLAETSKKPWRWFWKQIGSWPRNRSRGNRSQKNLLSW